MFPTNYRSLQRSFSELPKSCQQLELTFLSTMVFRVAKILSTVGVDISVDRSFQSYQNSDNFKSWRSCSFQSYQKLTFLSTVAFRTTKILSTVGADIPVDRSFHN